jgi:hypothetical protein
VSELSADMTNLVETMARVEAQQESVEHEHDTGMEF